MPAKKRIRLGADERRESIVLAAIDLISTRGFYETSFQMIADECKLSQSAVLYHFKNRDQLFEAVLKQLVKRNHATVSGLMKPEDGALDRLRKHFWGNLSWALQFPTEGQTLLLLYYIASFNPHFAAIYAQMLETARGRIREHLLAGVREKTVRADLDPIVTSQSLHDALIGSMINYLSTVRSGSVPADPRERWEQLFRSLQPLPSSTQ